MKPPRWIQGPLAILVWVVAVQPAHSQPDFSGTWILDRTSSQIPAPRGIPEWLLAGELTFAINHQGAALKIERRVKAPLVERSLVTTYYTDGREVVNRNPRGEPVHSRSSWQGNALVTELRGTVERNGKKETMEGKDVLRLSDDGRILTLESIRRVGGDTDAPQARLTFVKR